VAIAKSLPIKHVRATPHRGSAPPPPGVFCRQNHCPRADKWSPPVPLLALPPSPGERACVSCVSRSEEVAPGRCRSREGRRRSRGLDSSTPLRHRVSGYHAPLPRPPLHFKATAPGTSTADPCPGAGQLLLEEAAELESASHHALPRPLPLIRSCHQEGAELAAGMRERAGSRGRTRPSLRWR
jgi:hypothetical protein